MSNDKKEYTKKFLRVDLTEDEKTVLAKDMAVATIRKADVESEKKSADASFKDRIATCELKISKNARLINDGYEMRDVECEVVRDFISGVVFTFRTDTGAIVDEKAMTGAERQMHIEDIVKRDRIELSVTTADEMRQQEDVSREEIEEEQKRKDIQREMSSEKSAL